LELSEKIKFDAYFTLIIKFIASFTNIVLKFFQRQLNSKKVN